MNVTDRVTRLAILKIRDALDGIATEDAQTIAAGIEFSVTVGSGDDEQTIPIVEVADMVMWLERYYSWVFTATQHRDEDGEWVDMVPINELISKWQQFIRRRSKAIEQWIIDIYTKLDPLLTGWEKVDSTKKYDKYGWTDTFNKYVANDSRTGWHRDISFSGTAPVISTTKTLDPMERKSTSNMASTSETKLAANTASPASASEAGVMTYGTSQTGATPETDVYTGTFQSPADNMPMTTKQTNVGDTAARASSGSHDVDSTAGSNYSNGAELGTVSRNFDGKEISETNKEAVNSDIIERMKSYIHFDVTSSLLEDFFKEVTFYVDNRVTNEWGDEVWL